MSFIRYDSYEPAHLSYSSMDGFRTCGARFKLQKVLQVEQKPGLAGIGGNAVHAASELWDLGMCHNQPAIPTAQELFQHAWDEEIEKRKEQSPSYDVSEYVATGRASAAYGGKRGVQWWLDNGPGMVQAWIDWRLQHQDWAIWETPEGLPAIELKLTITLPNGFPVLMFLDRVMVTPAGQMVVLDIKTGRTPETAEQLGLYALGIEQTYGEMFRPDWGYFWTPDKGHSSPQALGMYTADYFDDIATQTAAGINAGVFLAKPQNGCVRWCGVSRFCAAVGGTPPTLEAS